MFQLYIGKTFFLFEVLSLLLRLPAVAAEDTTTINTCFNIGFIFVPVIGIVAIIIGHASTAEHA